MAEYVPMTEQEEAEFWATLEEMSNEIINDEDLPF